MSETVISATISSLGFLEREIYQPEPDFVAGIHDLIKFLHNDEQDHIARRICLSKNVLKNDLIPFLATVDTHDEDFGLVLRLALNLCQPALSVFHFRMPETEQEIQIYCDIDINLVNNLEAFCSKKLFLKLNNKIKQFYGVELIDRREVDKILVDRVIMLIRYAFSIGMEGPKCAEISSVDVKSKRQMIDSFLSSGVGETLFSIAKSKMDAELSVHILAIISLLFRSFPCECIAIICDDYKTRNTEAEVVLKVKLDHEVNRIAQKRRNLQTRQLGSNYIIKNAALNPNNDLLVQNPICDDPLNVIKRRKHAKGPGKRYMVKNFVESVFKENVSVSRDLALRVREYCICLINMGFDKLMSSTRDTVFSVNRQGLYIYNDVNYFSLATFVIEFIRLARLPLENVSFVLSTSFFNHIISQTEIYLDSLKTDKQNVKLLVIRAQYSISTFKEVCHLLYTISTTAGEAVKLAYEQVCTQIYDREEYREFCYLTLGRLKPQTMTKRLLEDIIMGTHYFLTVMEKRFKSGQLDTIKLKKKKKKIKKATKDKAVSTRINEVFEYNQLDPDELGRTWDSLKDELFECLRGDIQPTQGLIPIDTALNVDDDLYQTFALCQIQNALRDRRILDGVGLFYASRDLWPDSAFGTHLSTHEELMDNMLEIFNVNLSKEAKKYFEERSKVYQTVCNEEECIGPSVSDAEDEGHEDSDSEYETTTIAFQLSNYLQSFAKPDILYWYVYVLKQFELNTDSVNKACLKMLHRISFDQGSHSRLYLASLFTTFLEISQHFQHLPKDQWKIHRNFELYQFGFFLIKHFLKHLQKRGERLIAEILFFKTPKECFDIQEGYGEYEARNAKAPLESIWPEELEEEVKQLYNEYTALEDPPEGIDILDYIASNLSKERYPKQIKRHLKRLGLLVKDDKSRKQRQNKGRKSKGKDETDSLDDERETNVNEESDSKNSESNPSISDGENYLDDFGKILKPSTRFAFHREQQNTENSEVLSDLDDKSQEEGDKPRGRKRIIDSDDEDEVQIRPKKIFIDDDGE